MERARPLRPDGRRFGSVVFDCDSTLSAIEGIDELAGPHAAAIAALTDAAMRGEVALEEVYGRRLALVRPTRADVEALGRRYVEAVVPDAAEVVRALTRESVAVRIISGGLLPAVRALAAAIGVAPGDVAAVDIRFDVAGRYAGFDEASPLARSGGKRAVLAAWRAALPSPIILVGDGATDLEARPEVDAFIAFAGVVARPAVIAGADAVVIDRSLAPVLALALGETAPRDEGDRAVYERGRGLLAAAGTRIPNATD